MAIKWVAGYHGLGDQAFQRPAIAGLLRDGHTVYLETPYPPAYLDIQRAYPERLFFTRPATRLLNQRKYINAWGSRNTWDSPPPNTVRDTCFYLSKHLKRGHSAITAMAASLGVEPDYDYSRFSPELLREIAEWEEDPTSRVIAVKLPTIRKEWPCPSRNPAPVFFTAFVNQVAQDTGYAVVSYAALDKGETLDCNVPRGLLVQTAAGNPFRRLYEILFGGEFSIITESFAAPWAAATGARSVYVAGGHVRPHRLLMGFKGERVTVIAPTVFCECFDRTHDCEKKYVNPLLASKRALRGLYLNGVTNVPGN